MSKAFSPTRAKDAIKTATRENPFTRSIHNQAWIMPVTGLCVVLGFMVASAWVTKETSASRSLFLGADQRSRVGNSVDAEEFARLQVEVTQLRQDKTKLENTVAGGGPGEKTLNDALQDAKVFAGLTPAEGPGVVVTLTDKPSEGKKRMGSEPVFEDSFGEDIIHDLDIRELVNEMWASGAEAVSVNNLRISSGTWIRCAGPTILVDGARISSPFVVRAIGDQATLMGGLKLPQGILDQIKANTTSMVKLEEAKKIHMPAYAGPTGRKLLTVPKEAK